MKILKTTAFSAACAFLACASFAQQPAANAAQAAKAAPAQSAEQPAPATMNVASNEDRSYLADYDGKSATVTLFDEKAKRENVATFKSATDSAVVFVGGGGDYSVSKKKPSSLKVVVKPDGNWFRIRTALARENWDEAIAYMRPFVYPLIPLMSITDENFKGYVYLEMYLNALMNAQRPKEAIAIIDALRLGDCAPALVSTCLSVAESLAKSGNKKAALDIVEKAPFTGIYAQIIPDFFPVLAELRKQGMMQECGVFYTKLMAVDSPSKNEATLWMVYCDLSLGKKMSAEIYLNRMNLDKKSPEFSLLKMTQGMLAAKADKPNYRTVLDSYAEGIVFGSLSSPWMPELLYNAGMTYKKIGKQYAANEIFAQMAAFYPNDSLSAKGQKEIVKIERKAKKAVSDDDDDDDE